MKTKGEIKMTNAKWEEQIIAVPTEKLFKDVERGQGVITDGWRISKVYDAIEDNYVIMRRGNSADPTPKENNSEINYDYKQPIPYVIVRRGDEVFCYERLEGGGEARLHNKISLGVGGHMNDEEGTFRDVLKINTYRELEEEISYDAESELKTIGILNDDSNDVSKVHLGILLELVLPIGTEVTVRETDQLRGFWATIEELRTTYYDRLESWSQITATNMK